MRPFIRHLILLSGVLAFASGCRPLITFGTEHDSKISRSLPLCERVVERMIACSTDRAYRKRVGKARARVVASCRKHGKAQAARCDAAKGCNAFARCLAK